MKYNPYTQKLFSDQGEFIKQMHCPLKKQWKDLRKGFCKSCSEQVHDTKNMTDLEVLNLLKDNPQACIKIDLHNLNLGNYESY